MPGKGGAGLMRYLTFALTKGRLANKTLDMFEKIGITCEEMRDKDSRKLIFTNEELKLKFFLAKGPDVPTYVPRICSFLPYTACILVIFPVKANPAVTKSVQITPHMLAGR